MSMHVHAACQSYTRIVETRQAALCLSRGELLPIAGGKFGMTKAHMPQTTSVAPQPDNLESQPIAGGNH